MTPGVSLNDSVLESNKNNYLASISRSGNLYGISFLDISTGEFSVTDCDFDQLEKLLNTYNPSEILCSKEEKAFIQEHFVNLNVFYLDDWVYKIGYAHDKVLSFFKVKNLKGYGVEEEKNGIISAGTILFYLELTEHKTLSK